MCGRYEFTLEEPTLRALWEQAQQRFPEVRMEAGEIVPASFAPALRREGNGILPQPMQWGFPSGASGLVINARAETAAAKAMFRDALRHGRCAIPASAFYEWSHDRAHNKYSLRQPGHKVLYLAGLYRAYRDGCRFVILTRPANQSVADLHDRMPVLLPPERVEDWVRDDTQTEELLTCEAPLLDRRSEGYEQQSLF
nr:SOS response-associated peptidase family protein [uncultured Agathobaculum sp.]